MIQLQEKSTSVCSPNWEVCRLFASLWAGHHDITLYAAITLFHFLFLNNQKVLQLLIFLILLLKFFFLLKSMRQHHLCNMLQMWLQSYMKRLHNLKHLHNVETRLYCPQTFLSSDLQCRHDVSGLKYTFRD